MFNKGKQLKLICSQCTLVMCTFKKICALKKNIMFLCPVKREKRHYVLKSGKFNSLLSTSCPSWTAFRIINYPLKYTVEVLSAGMRPGEKGKLCDLATYKLLTPGLSPGRLPESSQKSLSQTSHLDFVSVTFTRAVTPGTCYSPSFQYTYRRDGGRRGADESNRGWIILVIKIKHTPQEFLADSHYLCIISFPPILLPSSWLSSAYTKDGRGSERVRDMLTRGC